MATLLLCAIAILGCREDTATLDLRIESEQLVESGSDNPEQAAPGDGSGTLYVSTDGDDVAGDGSLGNPYATLPRALLESEPGIKIQMQPGIWYPTERIDIGVSGLEDAPITICGDGLATIDCVDVPSGQDGLYIHDNAWVTVDGVNVKNTEGDGADGISIRFSEHVTVRNLELAYNGDRGLFSSRSYRLHVANVHSHHATDEHGIYLSNRGDHYVVENCVLHDNGDTGLQINADGEESHDAVIRGNVIYGNGGTAINLDGVNSSSIYNNVIFNNEGSGISNYIIDSDPGSVGGNNITHNIIYSGPGGNYGIKLRNGSNNNVIKNNVIICVSAEDPLIDMSVDASDQTMIDNNVYYQVEGPWFVHGGNAYDSLEEWRAASGHDVNSIAVTGPEDVFADYLNGDYHHGVGSPAVDAGSDLLFNIFFDADGNPRPLNGAYDIGAYESQVITGVPGP